MARQIEGNKRKTYGSVGTTRGDVGSMTYSTGKKQAASTTGLTSTPRGGKSAAYSTPKADSLSPKAGAYKSKSVDNGFGPASNPTRGAFPAAKRAWGMSPANAKTSGK